MKKDKFKNLDSDTKTIYFYGVIFIFIIIISLIFKLLPSDSEKKQVSNKTIQEEEINYNVLLNSISNNYELDMIVNKYYFNEYVNIKKQDENEIISINKFNSNSTYKEKDIINEDIDLTFVNPYNMLKLLNVKTYSNQNKYMIEATNYLKIYNEINNSQVEKIVSGEISIEFLSSKNNEYNIKMDLSNLYKNLNYDYKSVIYNIRFYNIGKINLSNNN